MDLQSTKLMYLKAVLFVVLGSMSASLIIARNPEVMTALLLAIAIWAFCRAYYFAFYVIEHYIDGSYRFSGLLSFLRSLRRNEQMKRRSARALAVDGDVSAVRGHDLQHD